MILYLDTSVIVKLYIEEHDSEDVMAAAAEATSVFTSRLAYPETRAAFERRRREKSISPAAAKTVCQAFETDWASWVAVEFNAGIAASAAQLAEKHWLRAADAIHLASFERILASVEDEDVQFLCADERSSKAARSLS